MDITHGPLRAARHIGAPRVCLYSLLALLTACSSAQADRHDPPTLPAARADDTANAWPTYLARLRTLPVDYTQLGCERSAAINVCHYDMVSQRWPEADPKGTAWHHRVDIYQPRATHTGTPLLVINNGTATGQDAHPAQPPAEWDAATLTDIATSTNRVVVSLGDAPNQYLAVHGESPRHEDGLVASTWRLYMDRPEHDASLPLHVPMAAAAVRAMDLATDALQLRDPSFVVTGASKRAWAAWLAVVGDKRVAGVVPYVMGMNIVPLIDHIRAGYGGALPIALAPYLMQGIVPEGYKRPEFARMMRISDPYSYLNGPLHDRLAIPKYIVNAGGDDFFPPDVATLYAGQLPGSTALQTIPNIDHGGIRQHMRETLVPFLKRWDVGMPLPNIHAMRSGADGTSVVTMDVSEAPVEVTRWQAVNPVSRDFRHACGVQYVATPLPADTRRLELPAPATGWSATFVAFRFADGFTATTPVFVTPQDLYPAVPPANGSGACLVVGAG